jgi:xylan 1,4-beta-xylosidase
MKTITLKPDWTGPSKAFRHTWEGLANIDQFRWMVRRDTQEHLKRAHDELGARHVRAVGMFDDEMRVIGTDPKSFHCPAETTKPRTNWQVVDYVIDSLLEIGINPMFTTTFTPTALASGTQTTFSTRSNITPPQDLKAWGDLVGKGVRHMLDRYGHAVVSKWYYEVWNEPNLSSFWTGDRAQFLALWATTFRAIKDVDATLRVGGPSTARAEWIGELIDYGRRNDCVPDFIITHVYNNDSASSPLSPFDGPQKDKENKSPHFAAGVVRGVRSLLDTLGYKGEIHWNEWGRSWWPYFPSRETANEAAFVAKTMAEVSQQADYFAYWCLSDIYDQVGYGAETFHGNYGLLNLQGLRKPPYHAFQALGMMGTQRVDVAGSSLDALTNAVATRGGNTFELLVYSYDPDDARSSLEVAVDLPRDSADVTIHRISDTDNNILSNWKEMGSPDYLKRSQLEALRGANQFRASPEKIQVKTSDNSPVAHFRMTTPGVVLLRGRN